MAVYAMNANTLSFSKYEGLTLAGLAAHDGVLYGIRAGGLLKFAGTDDEGTDIDAYTQTGKMDMGSGNLKRFPRLYVGGTASGGLTATLTTKESGVSKARNYPMAPWAGSLRERVAKLAGGPKSRHVQTKLANVNGGSMVIEQADLLVSGLPRRV